MAPSLVTSESESATASPGAVDLLAKINPARDAAYGRWEKRGERLLMPDTAFARLEIPFEPPEEYELTGTIECDSHAEGFCLGLVVGNAQTTLIIDGANQTTWLDQVDDSGSDNETAKGGRFLKDGLRNTVVCTVRKTGVQVVCNGATLIDWTGSSSRLSTAPWWKTTEPRHLYLGTLGPSYAVSKLELRPLGTATSADSKTPSGPADAQRDGDRFVSLFNGKDLADWNVETGEPGQWTVEGPQLTAVIAGRAREVSRRSFLLSTRDYSDFVLRFEFLLEPGMNAAVAFRAIPGERLPQVPGRTTAGHPLIKLTDTARFPEQPLGTISWVKNDKIHTDPDRTPSLLKGAWHAAELTVRGQTCSFVVDDQVVVDAVLDSTAGVSGIPGLNRARGKIGFQAAEGTIRIRKVRIKTASDSQQTPAASAATPGGVTAGSAKTDGLGMEDLIGESRSSVSRVERPQASPAPASQPRSLADLTSRTQGLPPPPEGETLTQAKESVENRYKADGAAAKTPQLKAALAQQLIQEAPARR